MSLNQHRRGYPLVDPDLSAGTQYGYRDPFRHIKVRVTPHGDLRRWLQTQYSSARQAAAQAGAARTASGNSRALEHASAVARMAALGEVIKRLDLESHLDPAERTTDRG